jgi:phage shock protein PspC (stress-responsive transcriptional regulator)
MREGGVREDGEAMTTNTEYTAPPPVPPAPRPPLRRSQSDKVIAGVAGGFARWLGIDPVIVRVILVVLAVFGGSGLLLYVIGWLFIPMEGSSTSSADDFFRDSRRQGSTARTVLIVIGVVVAVILFLNVMGSMFGGWGGGSVLLLLAVGILVLYLVNRQPSGTATYVTAPPEPAMPMTSDTIVADVPAAPPAAYAYGGSGQYPGYVAPQPTPIPPQPPRPRSYLGLITLSVVVLVTGLLTILEVTGIVDLAPAVIPAVALAILGAGILVGAWVGRARWLLWFAIPTLFVTITASYVPADLGDSLRSGLSAGVGERSWTPTTVLEATRPHELGIGSAQLDLTELVIPPGSTIVPVKATVGLGELIVTVPDGVRVLVDASVGTGDITIEGLPSTNDPSPSADIELPDGPETGPVIDLTLHTNVGSLEVSRA